MNKKNLILATIFLTISLAVVSTVIAKTDAKDVIEDLVNRGLGVWRAHGFAIKDFDNYKLINIRFLKTPWPMIACKNSQPSCVREFHMGSLWLDGQIYSLKNIQFVPKTKMTADVFSNDVKVGSIELQRDLTKKPNIWTGTLTFDTENTQYHVFIYANPYKIPRPTAQAAEKILNENSNEEE